MPALIGAIGTVVNMNQAVYGNAMGNPAYQSQLAVANATGGQASLIAGYNASLASTAAATLATTVMNNMFVTVAAGVTQANVTALTTALTQAFAAYPTAKGQVISNLANLLGGLEGEASWGAAATAFNNQAAADFVYSTNTANTNAGVPSSVSTYTLTTGVDAVGSTYTSATGTVTGVAASTTLNVFDTISMSTTGTANTITANMANTDIAALDGSVLPILNGVQILNVQNANNTGGNTADLTIGPNLTTFNLVSALTGGLLTASGANANLRTIGLNGTTASNVDLTVQYAAGALTGTSDALTLNLTGQLTAATPTAAISTDLIVSGGAALAGFETVNLNVASASRLGVLTINDSAAASTLTTLNISGAGSFRDYAALVFKTGVVGVINGSTNTGGVTVVVGAQDISMTRGTGSDSITFNAAGAYNANDTVRLGSGTNDVIVLADAAINTTTSALNSLITASEAETVGFSLAATVDMDFLTQTIISVNSTTDVALTVQKLAATDTVVVNTGTNAAADVTAAGSLGFTTANITLAGTGTASVNMDDLDVTGNAIVNIASNGTNTAAANVLADLLLSANAVVTVTGTQGLTVTNAMANTSVVVNGSGLTGNAVLTVTAGTAASSLVGGLNNDVLTGGTGADTIVGGAGNDTISTGTDIANGNSVTGGLGADAISIGNAAVDDVTYGINVTAAESYATAGQFDTITQVAIANTDESIITLTTGVLTSTATAATSVNLGVTTVTAGAFLIVAATATLAATDQDISVYQDSDSDGIIEATDLRVDVAAAGAGETTAVSIVGDKLQILILGA